MNNKSKIIITMITCFALISCMTIISAADVPNTNHNNTHNQISKVHSTIKEPVIAQNTEIKTMNTKNNNIQRNNLKDNQNNENFQNQQSKPNLMEKKSLPENQKQPETTKNNKTPAMTKMPEQDQNNILTNMTPNFNDNTLPEIQKPINNEMSGDQKLPMNINNSMNISIPQQPQQDQKSILTNMTPNFNDNMLPEIQQPENKQPMNTNNPNNNTMPQKPQQNFNNDIPNSELNIAPEFGGNMFAFPNENTNGSEPVQALNQSENSKNNIKPDLNKNQKLQYPQKQEPQKQEPQKQEPQKQEPQKQEPQKQEPQKQEPQKQQHPQHPKKPQNFNKNIPKTMPNNNPKFNNNPKSNNENIKINQKPIKNQKNHNKFNKNTNTILQKNHKTNNNNNPITPQNIDKPEMENSIKTMNNTKPNYNNNQMPTNNNNNTQSNSITYSTSSNGQLHVSGTTITKNNKNYTVTDSETNTVLVQNGGTLNLSNSKITKTGNTTNSGNSEFLGTNAAILTTYGSTAYITNSTIVTDASGANAIFATNTDSSHSGATIYVNDTTIDTYQDKSRGLDATYGGKIIANNVTINTRGGSCAALATDRGEGIVTVSDSVLNTGVDNGTGQGSPCIYSTGEITVINSTGTAFGAQIACIEGKNSINLTNSSFYCSGEGNRQENGKYVDLAGVFIYQSMSGDADVGTAVFTSTNSNLSILSTSDYYKTAPMFYVTNTKGIVTLTNTTLNFGSGVLIKVSNQNQWGTTGSMVEILLLKQ